MRSRFLTDYETKTLNTYDELKKYLLFRKNNDEWIQDVSIDSLAAIGIPNLPICFPELCSGNKVNIKGYSMYVDDIRYEEMSEAECINDTGLFLVVPYNNKFTVFPTRGTAYTSILRRAEDDCGTMYRQVSRSNKKVLPINEKAERLTRDFSLYSDPCKILYRDGKISAVLSKDYRILPADELIALLESRLSAEHPEYAYSWGMVSHEYLLAEFLLNDEIREDSFMLKLNEMGFDIHVLKAGVAFSTSDIGLSQVKATVFYIADGQKFYLNSISMEHKGKATVEMFEDKLQGLAASFKDAEDRVEELGNMEIEDVSGCVRKVCNENSFMPKKEAEEVINELVALFPKGGTGMDVYLALNRIIQQHAKKNNLSPLRYVTLTDQVAGLMNLPFDKLLKDKD